MALILFKPRFLKNQTKSIIETAETDKRWHRWLRECLRFLAERLEFDGVLFLAGRVQLKVVYAESPQSYKSNIRNLESGLAFKREELRRTFGVLLVSDVSFSARIEHAENRLQVGVLE